jgi:hypothetical protein
MHHRIRTLLAVFTLAGVGFVSQLSAQGGAAEKPSVGDLKEEQRKISNAYLGDADFQLKTARERLGTNNHRLSQQSGLWAVEQLAYAKLRLEKHAPKIEEAQGIFGRASEGTRKELRDAYAKVRQNYVDIEERVDIVAQALEKAGWPILAKTLAKVRGSSGQGAIDAVREGLNSAGQQGKGDQLGGGAGAGGGGGGGEGGGGGPAALTGGGTAMQNGANVTFSFPDGTSMSAQNCTLSADGKTLNSPDVGPIDVSSIRKDANGNIVGKTMDGRDVYLGKDGKWHVGSPGGASNRTTINNRGPQQGDTYINEKGERITIGPDWKEPPREGVSKDYIGGGGARLMSETKVTRQMVSAGAGQWKSQETPGEARPWNLSIRVGEQKRSGDGSTMNLTLDAGGSGAIARATWEVVDQASGTRATVAPGSSPTEGVATFTKPGDYTITATGETDWGSPFRITKSTGVYW